MPIKKASFKSLRQSKKRAIHNQKIKETLKKTIKASRELLAGGKAKEAKEEILKAVKTLDKAAGKGIIKKNTAARKKSRLMKKLNALMKK